MTKKEMILAFIGSAILAVMFFYKIFVGLVPIPTDLLTGAYYPWLDYKWGYAVSVPVKNPALSDVMSTSYPWKFIVSTMWSQGIVPLWNPYIFSGFPLLANWQSGVFYPLNLLMIVFGPKLGWSLMTLAQPLLAVFFMYLFLRSINFQKLPSVMGGIIFGYAGYMMIFLEYNYLQAGIWLPLCLFLIEKYVVTLRTQWLLGITPLIFIIFSAGNFQVTLYSLLIIVTYFLFRLFNEKRKIKNLSKVITIVSGLFVLGLGLTAIQMFPTFELFQNSIRQFDSNIVQYNFGLIPLSNLITFIIPDFFGNPVTGNFRGFIYHESMGYFGIIPLILVATLIFSKKSSLDKYFLALLMVAVMLVLDTWVGRIIFWLKIPLISTSYASRALFILTFAAAVLTASAFSKIGANKNLHFGKGIIGVTALLVATIVSLFLFGWFQLIGNNALISLRNSIFPFILVLVTGLLYLFFKHNKQLLMKGLILITIIDLFRFGLKYNTFVRSDLVYPNTPVVDYLQKNIGSFRVEREKTEVFPPNTWMVYGLSSPEGYDPLAYLPYARFFNVYNGNSPDSGISRYLELGNYKSPFLDLLGVKYLVMAKRQGDKITPEGKVGLASGSSRFKSSFEDQSIEVLENTTVMPRVQLFDSYQLSPNNGLDTLFQGLDFKKTVILDADINKRLGSLSSKDEAKLISYSPNQVVVDTFSDKGSKILLLSDTDYPGWEAWIGNRREKIYQADGIFRAVLIPEGKSTVRFIFHPLSFIFGAAITAASLLIWFGLVLWIIIRRYNER